MDTGLDGFKQLLKEFRSLAAWGAGGAAVPFAAQLAALSPPWPDGIVIITSIVELVALVFVYQFTKAAHRCTVNLILTVAAVFMVLSGVSYLAGNSIYTFKVPTTKERFVKGYRCTPDAQLVFKEKCPALTMDDLAEANYEAERLWTLQSIATVRVALTVLWLASFIALAVVIGSFVVYQAQIPGQKTQPDAKPEP